MASLTCSRCSQIMRDGGRTGCVVRDAEVYLPEFRQGRSRHGVEVTDLGRFFIRNVCMVFDRYLERNPGDRVYSRTV